MHIEENIHLAQFTTFKIGGNARFFTVVRSLQDLKDAVHFAQENSVPFFILGGGSNVLISDNGFRGLVIKMEIQGIEYIDDGGEYVKVKVGAGEEWDFLVGQVVGRGLYGLENLSLIPGTVGASPIQNIGAYGVEVGECINSVYVYDTHTQIERVLLHDECEFSYRDSIFKKQNGKCLVVIAVEFNLSKKKKLDTRYKDIEDYCTAHKIETSSLTLQKLREIIINIRTYKLPNLHEFGTAGSFFKNPIISRKDYDELLQRYPDMPHYGFDDVNVKVPLGWILDRVCNFKGVREGNVGTYKNQALVIVNFGSASSSDLRTFVEKIKKSVREKTKIEIHEEVHYIA